jgi:hypothetical protein
MDKIILFLDFNQNTIGTFGCKKCNKLIISAFFWNSFKNKTLHFLDDAISAAISSSKAMSKIPSPFFQT